MSNQGYLPIPKGIATRSIHAGQEPEQWNFNSVIPPIVQSTTFKQRIPGGKDQEYTYGRSSNPSRTVLEKCLASIESAKHALCFSSGLGAISMVMSIFDSGDHIITGKDIYGGSTRLFENVGKRLGFQISFVDIGKLEVLKKTITPRTKMIWMESPTNPTLTVLDIKAIAAVANAHGLVLAVDNTFLSPYFQRPLELGAHLSVYSLTKYMNGHSDVVMGAVVCNDSGLFERLKFLQNSMGSVPSPFDCALVNRGLKTLAVRMPRHGASSLAVAKYLKSHPKVEKVLHPGLPCHPNHELCKKQTSGHSGMLSFYLKDCGLEEAETFLEALEMIALAESLGGFESLAELPVKMSHGSIPDEELQALGITPNMIRLSVGLEDPEDIIADLQNALDRI